MTQSYHNHRRFDPLYHFLAAPLALLTVIAAGMALPELFRSGRHALALAAIAGPAALLLTTINTRRYGLLLQDRIIAAEVAERYGRLAGEPFAPLAARLQPRQIVALRFAGDTELVPLARRAAAEGLDPDAIKRAIAEWRPDLRRV